MKIFEVDNIIIKLGCNRKENQNLIDNSNDNFWWFHLSDYPSGHCVVESDKINKKIKKIAGVIVKNNSKYKNLKNIIVDYTQIKNLKPTKTIGEVNITNYLSFKI